MNLLLVEDSELISNQLIRLIDSRPEVHIIGVARDEETAIRMLQEHSPDAVLLDLALAPGSGVSILKWLRATGLKTPTLVLTNDSGDTLRRACETLGALGFYDKNSQVDACMAHLFSWLPKPT